MAKITIMLAMMLGALTNWRAKSSRAPTLLGGWAQKATGEVGKLGGAAINVNDFGWEYPSHRR